MHVPGTLANGTLDSKRDARNLQASKNGAESKPMGKSRWRAQQAQAQMAVGAGKRGRRIKFGRRIGATEKRCSLRREDLWGTTKSWMAGRPASAKRIRI